VVAGSRTARRRQKRADYLLRYTRDLPIAVVEAKADYQAPGQGLGQAKDYAEVLGLKFAYSTNGEGIVEFDFLTGSEKNLHAFPTPGELWQRLKATQGISNDQETKLLTPGFHSPGRTLRYYQEVAVNRTVQAIVQGKRRLLLTMATETGKTETAFQICWRLWSARWNRDGRPTKPRILYLADRNILIDDPKDKTFAAFGDARAKIDAGNAIMSREMYFAIYQALAGSEGRPPLYQQYPRDFFDLIIVDECHRGSAREDSNWREILEYFEPAYQLGMTATPLREDNRDTYRYFGAPIYTYSLRDGIEDGFLAPYRVHRAFTPWDAVGWRPSEGELDRYGREIPDDEYQTKDFERVVALKARTEAVARHLTAHLKKTDRFGKTIVFCVDQEHALDMRQALINLNQDLVREHPNYVERVTSDEGDIGRGHLSNFQDLEKQTPVILTTSQLLTTGVDAPTCRNIVLVRVINSMTEFKQIIGRGTRVRDDYGKLFFTILDYTGAATRLFADPDFDGEPVRAIEETIDEEGETVPGTEAEVSPEETTDEGDDGPAIIIDEEERGRRKFYFDGDHVEVVGEVVYDLDADGKKLSVIKLTDYAGQKVRTLFPLAADLRRRWADPGERSEIIDMLTERGIDFDTLAASANQPDADPFDLLCHLAYNSPLRTRRERAELLRRDRTDFFDQYGLNRPGFSGGSSS
jgi:type I restriction enzyme R subunit